MLSTWQVDQIARTFRLLDGPGRVVRWAARKGEEMEGSWAASPIELVQFAEAYKDWDFYVQVNPSNKRHGRRCSTEDIIAWEWFVVDLDPVTTGETVQSVLTSHLDDAERAVLNAVRAYTGQAYEATTIDSGRGRQLWFRVGTILDSPMSGYRDAWPLYADGGAPREHIRKKADLVAGEVVETGSLLMRDAITCAQRYWLSQLASRQPHADIVVDPSVSDLPRLMRCPGTVNRKTGRIARFMYSSDPLVQEGLGAKLLRYTPDDRLWPAPKPNTGLVPHGAPWQVAVAKVNLTAANFITFGATEPGRHRACSAAARALAEVGLSQSEILLALTAGGARSRPELDDHAYLERTARDAYARFGREVPEEPMESLKRKIDEDIIKKFS